MIFDLARFNNKTWYKKSREEFSNSRGTCRKMEKIQFYSRNSTLDKPRKASQSSHFRSLRFSSEKSRSSVCATRRRRRRRSPQERKGKFICNMLRRITSDFLLSHLRNGEAPLAADRESLSVYYSPRADEVDRSIVAALRKRRTLFF